MKSVYVVLQVVARQDGGVTVNILHFLFYCWQDSGSVQAETIKKPLERSEALVMTVHALKGKLLKPRAKLQNKTEPLV